MRLHTHTTCYQSCISTAVSCISYPSPIHCSLPWDCTVCIRIPTQTPCKILYLAKLLASTWWNAMRNEPRGQENCIIAAMTLCNMHAVSVLAWFVCSGACKAARVLRNLVWRPCSQQCCDGLQQTGCYTISCLGRHLEESVHKEHTQQTMTLAHTTNTLAHTTHTIVHTTNTLAHTSLTP